MSCSNIIPDLKTYCGDLPQPEHGSTYALTMEVNDKLLITVDVPGVGQVRSMISVSGVWREDDKLKTDFNIHPVEIKQ